MLISKLKSLEKELSKNGELQFVAISVDPEIDSVEMLATYAKSHRHAQMKNWHFVTGNKDSIYELIRDTFASEVKRIESDDMRKFAHSEQFYIIDPKLRLRGVVNGTKVKLINKARVITSGI